MSNAWGGGLPYLQGQGCSSFLLGVIKYCFANIFSRYEIYLGASHTNRGRDAHNSS